MKILAFRKFGVYLRQFSAKKTIYKKIAWIFYIHSIAVSYDIRLLLTLCGYAFSCVVFLGGNNREATAFLVLLIILQILHKMPRNKNLGKGMKHSNAQTELTTNFIVELTSKYLTEKNAKNQAYFFILSNNLLDKFQNFCAKHKDVDAHQACLKFIKSKI